MNDKPLLACNRYGLTRLLALTLGSALLTSCATLGPSKTESLTQATPASQGSTPESQAVPTQVAAELEDPPGLAAPKPNPLYAWKGQGRWVSRMEIDVDQQKAHFYDGNEEIGWTTIASGLRNYPTPTGRFTVAEKVKVKESNLYGKIFDRNGRLIRAEAKADVDPVPPGGRFEGAKMPFFLRLTGDGIGLHAGPIPRPGSRASHGCIRMPKGFAPILFDHVKIGTPVTIVGDGPAYGAYLAEQQARNQARIAKAAKATPQPSKAPPSAPAELPVDKEAVANATPAGYMPAHPTPVTGAVDTIPAAANAPPPVVADKATTPSATVPVAAKATPIPPVQAPLPSVESAALPSKTVPGVSDKPVAPPATAPITASKAAPVPSEQAPPPPTPPPAGKGNHPVSDKAPPPGESAPNLTKMAPPQPGKVPPAVPPTPASATGATDPAPAAAPAPQAPAAPQATTPTMAGEKPKGAAS